MPLVSDDFVKNAEALAKGVPELQAKLAEVQKKAEETEKAASTKTNDAVLPLIEATVNTLVEQGLIPATEKSAAANSLKSHEETLQALLKTAQQVKAETMGVPEKVASTQFTGGRSDINESDRMLLNRLGFQV